MSQNSRDKLPGVLNLFEKRDLGVRLEVIGQRVPVVGLEPLSTPSISQNGIVGITFCKAAGKFDM